VAIGAGAEEAGVAGGVLVGCGAEVVDDFALGLLAGNVEVAGEAVLAGMTSKERVDGRRADVGEHLEAFGGAFWKVAHCGSLRDQGIRGQKTPEESAVSYCENLRPNGVRPSMKNQLLNLA